MRLRQRVSSKWLVSAATSVALAVPALALSSAAFTASAAPVVQALPSADQQKLQAALARLGRDPRDVSALIDAGDAARKLGDFDAAIGFYRRADEISGGNARIKAGLAASLAQSGDPVAALPLFAEAERAGASTAQLAADRGLAYDLVGDNAAAQRYYMLAIGGVNDEEVRMRLAISQAIAGDAKASEATIMPLLRKQDKPGWRTRAFSLAIAGDTKQAVEVSNTILPPQLAQNIAPYLRYMPRLTRAQQAAAANLGKFPRASEIGNDDARIAAYKPQQIARADANLVPRGEALGSGSSAAAARPAKTSANTRKGRSRTGARVASAPATGSYRLGAGRANSARTTAPSAGAEPARVAPPEPMPTIERGAAATGELPPIHAKPAVSAASQAVASPAPIASASSRALPVATPTSTVPPSTAPAAPARVAGTLAQAVPAKPTVAEAPPEPSAQQLSLEQIFADLGKPTMQIMPAVGAVDIRQIEPARPPAPKIEAPKPDPEAPKPAEKPVAKADLKAKSNAKANAKSVEDEEAAAGKAKPRTKAEIAKAKAEAAKAKKPAPPSHPSRIWVQIGVGRNKAAIAFDWRRYTKQSPALFKGREVYVSEMGRTNRMLVGPFATQKAASAFMADARKQGFSDALPWTSPAGQVVDPLSAD